MTPTLSQLRDLGVAYRRAAGVRAIETLVRSLSAAGRLLPDSRPGRHGVEVLRDVPYLSGGGPENSLDIYRPATRPPWPVALYVHGGGFNILSKDTHWVMGLQLARGGYLTFNINYRLAPRAPFPAALVDTGCALTWVVEHAAEYGGDLGRLVLAGESAGANLVTALTVACCYQRDEPWAEPIWQLGVVPSAVVPACGLLQVSDIARLQGAASLPLFVRDRLKSSTEAYIGGTAVPVERRELSDPLLVLERGAAPGRPLPPFCVPVGTADPVLDDTRRLAAALDALGVACDARYYSGEHHAFHALIWRDAAKRCWRDIFDFLDLHLGEAAA